MPAIKSYSDQDIGNTHIITSAEATASNHLTTKGQTDKSDQVNDFKQSVKIATTSELLFCSYNSEGYLQGNVFGIIDYTKFYNLTLNVNDRVLVKNQSNTIHNGIYVVTSLGSSTEYWRLTRSFDFNSNDEIAGSAVIEEYTGMLHLCLAKEPFVLGTSSITFASIATNNISSSIKDPTGFTNNGDIVVTYNSTNRTITLNGTFEAFYQNRKILELTDGWVSPAHNTGITNNIYLKYSDGNFIWSNSVWEFWELQIAIISFDPSGNFLFAIREPHGTMQWNSHMSDHYNRGTYKLGGGDISNYTLNSTTPALRRFDISSTSIYDEDLPTICSALNSKLYTQVYLTGANGVTSFNVDASDILPLSGSRPYVNTYTAGTWQQTLVNSGDYMTIFIAAMPVTADTFSQKKRFLFFQGQSSGSITAQESITTLNINLGNFTNLSPEYIFIGKVIIRYTGGDWSIVSISKINGSRNEQITLPVGTYISNVATDDTLYGSGITSDPLSVRGSYEYNSINSNRLLYTVLPKYILDRLIIENTTANTVVLSLGTTNGGFDISNEIEIISGDLVTIDVGLIFSKVNSTDIYISSSDWNSANLVINVLLKKL